MKLMGVAVGVAMLCAGCISISTYEGQMKTCRETSERARRLEHDLTAERAKSKELESLAAEQKAEHEALTTELNQVRGTYDELIHELKDDIARGEVAVVQTPDGLTITLDDQILFQSGRAELQPHGKRVLAQLAEVLQHVVDHEIHVQGHTDNVKIAGSLKARFQSNWDLSASRAASVVRFLEDSRKIDPRLLVLVAYADKRPLAENVTSQGRKINRRVDIVLVPKR